MNPYEELFSIIQNGSKKKEGIQIGVMESSTSCRIGNLILNRDDLYIAQHLVTGYLINDEKRVDGLKRGDLVTIYRINDDKYVILERVV